MIFCHQKYVANGTAHNSVESNLVDFFSTSYAASGWEWLSDGIKAWLGPMAHQLPSEFWIYGGDDAARLTTWAGVRGLAVGNQIVLGQGTSADREAVLRHELVHLAQVQSARNGVPVADIGTIEAEADEIARMPCAREVHIGAAPDRCYALVWFVALGAATYILLRPNVANAPGPDDPVLPSVDSGQILGEAFAIFVVPGGALKLGGRLGLGFLGSTALAGASGNISLRAVGDMSRGKASPPLMYLFDATTGAVIGFVVPGGVRLVGQAGTRSLDWLATRGVAQADIAIARALHDAARAGPINAELASHILQRQSLGGRVSQWWLNRRGVMVLYRGQDQATNQILSPLAREEGVVASRQLVQRMRAMGITDEEIAGFTAKFHTQPLPPFAAPPNLAGVRGGAVGIPTTRLPGLASAYGDEGVIYIIRVPKNVPIQPRGWQGLQIENEWVILNQLPEGAVVRAIPARSVAPLNVDKFGRLIQAQR